MLKENIRIIRRAKNLSQEDLAARLHVVRQTVSKWEQGLSVPDAEMLLSLSEELETPVSVLLGETAAGEEEPEPEGLKAIAERLEAINLELAQRKAAGIRRLRWLLLLLCAIAAAGLAALGVLGSFYLEWDLCDPETAAAAAILHGAEWLFVRTAPLVFAGAALGLFLTRKRGYRQRS